MRRDGRRATAGRDARRRLDDRTPTGRPLMPGGLTAKWAGVLPAAELHRRRLTRYYGIDTGRTADMFKNASISTRRSMPCDLVDGERCAGSKCTELVGDRAWHVIDAVQGNRSR